MSTFYIILLLHYSTKINLGFILDMHCPKKVCIESKSVYGYIVIHNIKLVLMCLIGRAMIIRR